jgi:hypothetical protein
MRPLYVSHAPFTKWVLAASVYRPLCRGWPLKGLSRMTVTCHVRFLGGLGSAMTPGYPVFANFCDYIIVSKVSRGVVFCKKYQFIGTCIFLTLHGAPNI